MMYVLSFHPYVLDDIGATCRTATGPSGHAVPATSTAPVILEGCSSLPIAVRSSTLLLPLADVSEFHIAGCCPACRTTLSVPLAGLTEQHPTAVIGQVASRLRCTGCGMRLAGLVLMEGAEGCEHAPLAEWPGTAGRAGPPSFEPHRVMPPARP